MANYGKWMIALLILGFPLYLAGNGRLSQFVALI